MGRGVFDELNNIPLPGRRNIVLSRTVQYDNVDTYTSLEEALDSISEDYAYIIGGGVLYRETISQANKMVVTLVKKEYEGDTYFPEYRTEIDKSWVETSRRETEDLVFLEYERA